MTSNRIINNDIEQMTEQVNIKDIVRNGINAEVSRNASYLKASDIIEVQNLADKLKDKAIKEITESESKIIWFKTLSRISQVVDYIFYIFYGIIGLEIMLELFGARDANKFKQFLDTISAPLVAPFNGLMPNISLGVFQLMLSYIVAIIVYWLFHLAIKGLFKLMLHKKAVV
ncbi:MAG: YggT family protein [Blastocatellia bacterium]|nr:YggT family protein [Blastocatellia bacterium]